MKLTGTNRSIELDRSHCPCSSPSERAKRSSGFGEGASLRPNAAKAKGLCQLDVLSCSRCRGFAASLHKARPETGVAPDACQALPLGSQPDAHSKDVFKIQRKQWPPNSSPYSLLAIAPSLTKSSFSLFALSRPGGSGGVAAPVPIPNTAVKRPSAYGTSS